jgi:hypothetical protein
LRVQSYLSFAAVVVSGCAMTSIRQSPILFLSVNERIEFGAGVNIPLLLCPEMMAPICEPLGRVGRTECYCAY